MLDAVDADPDLALLLVQGTTADARHYSVKHGLLVALIREFAAHQLPTCPATWRTSLRCAALTMNVAMTNLQNQLAVRETPSARSSADRSNPTRRTVLNCYARPALPTHCGWAPFNITTARAQGN